MIDGEQISSKFKRNYDFSGFVDHTGSILYVSGNYTDIMGFEPNEVIGTRLRDRIHPEDIGYIHDMHRNMILSKKTVECKFEVKTKDGSYIVIRTKVTPVFDNGEFIGSVMKAIKREGINMIFFRNTRILSVMNKKQRVAL